MFLCCFFFFKQKTAYEMRISDWSSDVCSSDLQIGRVIFDAADDEDHALLEQARINVVRTFAAGGLFNHHRYKLGAGQDVSHGVSVLEWCVTLQFPAHALIETNARHSSGRAFVPQSGCGLRRRRIKQLFEPPRLFAPRAPVPQAT